MKISEMEISENSASTIEGRNSKEAEVKRSPLKDFTNILMYKSGEEFNRANPCVPNTSNDSDRIYDKSEESGIKLFNKGLNDAETLPVKNCVGKNKQDEDLLYSEDIGEIASSRVEVEDDVFEDAKENILSLTMLAENLDTIHLSTPIKINTNSQHFHEFSEGIYNTFDNSKLKENSLNKSILVDPTLFLKEETSSGSATKINVNEINESYELHSVEGNNCNKDLGPLSETSQKDKGVYDNNIKSESGNEMLCLRNEYDFHDIKMEKSDKGQSELLIFNSNPDEQKAEDNKNLLPACSLINNSLDLKICQDSEDILVHQLATLEGENLKPGCTDTQTQFSINSNEECAIENSIDNEKGSSFQDSDVLLVHQPSTIKDEGVSVTAGSTDTNTQSSLNSIDDCSMENLIYNSESSRYHDSEDELVHSSSTLKGDYANVLAGCEDTKTQLSVKGNEECAVENLTSYKKGSRCQDSEDVLVLQPGTLKDVDTNVLAGCEDTKTQSSVKGNEECAIENLTNDKKGSRCQDSEDVLVHQQGTLKDVNTNVMADCEDTKTQSNTKGNEECAIENLTSDKKGSRCQDSEDVLVYQPGTLKDVNTNVLAGFEDIKTQSSVKGNKEHVIENLTNDNKSSVYLDSEVELLVPQLGSFKIEDVNEMAAGMNCNDDCFIDSLMINNPSSRSKDLDKGIVDSLKCYLLNVKPEIAIERQSKNIFNEECDQVNYNEAFRDQDLENINKESINTTHVSNSSSKKLKNTAESKSSLAGKLICLKNDESYKEIDVDITEYHSVNIIEIEKIDNDDINVNSTTNEERHGIEKDTKLESKCLSSAKEIHPRITLDVNKQYKIDNSQKSENSEYTTPKKCSLFEPGRNIFDSEIIFDDRVTEEAANISEQIINTTEDFQDSDSDADNNKTVITFDSYVDKNDSPSKRSTVLMTEENHYNLQNDSFSDRCKLKSMHSVFPVDLNQSESGPITAADELTTEDLEFQDGAKLDLDFFTKAGSIEGVLRNSLTRDSLYVKFDPIVSKIVSKTSNTFVMPLPSEDKKSNEEESNSKINNTKNKIQEDAERITPVQSPALDAVQKLISLTPTSASSVSVAPNKLGQENITSSHSVSTKGGSLCQDQLQKELNKFEDITKERELYFQMEMSKTHLNLEKKDMELKELASKKAALEDELIASTERESKLKKELIERTKSKQQLSLVMEEYEKTISQLVAQKEVEKKEFEVQKDLLMKERDTAMQHLNNMEIAFNDIHQKYERSKTVIEGMKANEDSLKTSLADYDEAIKSSNVKYESLKNHAIMQLETANQELDMMRRTHQAEIAKLKAMVKKAEVRVTSLEEALEQKSKENQELAAICDELINKVGSSGN